MAAKRKAAQAEERTITIPRSEPLAETRKREAVELSTDLRANPIVVRSDAQAEQVGEMIGELAAQKAELTRMLKSITDPINAGLKQARGLFKPAIDALDVPERMLRGILADYRLAQHNQLLAAREAAVKAAEAGDADALQVALSVPDPVASDGQTSTRFRWVVDRIDESKLDREWLTADVEKLKGYARATSGQDEIEPVAGVTFKREAVVVRK